MATMTLLSLSFDIPSHTASTPLLENRPSAQQSSSLGLDPRLTVITFESPPPFPISADWQLSQMKALDDEAFPPEAGKAPKSPSRAGENGAQQFVLLDLSVISEADKERYRQGDHSGAVPQIAAHLLYTLHKEKSVCVIHRFVVHPACRRRGIGSALLQYHRAYLKRQSIEKCELQVDPETEGAMKILRRNGFEERLDAEGHEENGKIMEWSGPQYSRDEKERRRMLYAAWNGVPQSWPEKEEGEDWVSTGSQRNGILQLSF